MDSKAFEKLKRSPECFPKSKTFPKSQRWLPKAKMVSKAKAATRKAKKIKNGFQMTKMDYSKGQHEFPNAKTASKRLKRLPSASGITPHAEGILFEHSQPQGDQLKLLLPLVLLPVRVCVIGSTTLPPMPHL